MNCPHCQALEARLRDLEGSIELVKSSQRGLNKRLTEVEKKQANTSLKRRPKKKPRPKPAVAGWGRMTIAEKRERIRARMGS